jgi:hypothetical protein
MLLVGVESCYWADNVKCEKPRYHDRPRVRRFACDKTGVRLPGD